MSKETPLDLVLDTDPQQIIFAGRDATPVSLTLTNNDSRNAISVLVNAVRGDLLTKNALSLTTEELTGGGYKVIDETWVECRIASPDVWQPVDDWATPFDLGALAAGASVSFEVQVNVPTADTSAGRMCFALMISASTGEDLRVLSVTIDQDDFTINEGDTTTATATVVAESGADDSVVWTSSDTDVATINISTGEITGVAAGSTVITAESNSNRNVKSSRYAVISEPSIVAGAVAWYDASDASTITESGGLVSKWADKSGNGNDLTESSAKPTTGAESLNGRNVLSFGGSQQLVGPDAVVPVSATPYTIFAVWKASGNSQALLGMGINSNGKALNIHIWSSGELMHTWYGVDQYSIPFGSVDAHLSVAQFDDVSGVMLTKKDDLSESGSVYGKNTTAANFTVGNIQSYAYSGPLNGLIAEIIIYHTVLTPAEIAANEAYLKTKWGL